MNKLIGLISFLLLCTGGLAQEKVIEGVLIRTNFYNSRIDTNDIADTWKTIDNQLGNTSESYEKVFSIRDTSFLLKKQNLENYIGYFPSSFVTTLINLKTKTGKTLFEGSFAQCGTGVYLSSAVKIIQTGRGFIFNNNLMGLSCYFSSNQLVNMISPDSSLRIVNIAGKINSDFLVVRRNPKDGLFYYYLENLDNSNNPGLNHEIKFENINYPAPEKLYQLTDSLVIMSFEWSNEFTVAKYSNSLITKIDAISTDYSYVWTFKNNRLYYAANNYLSKREFDKNSGKFGAARTILPAGGYRIFDINENYFATVCSDTVFIYSLAEDRLINKINIAYIKNYSGLMIDAPYLYIQKTDKITGVKGSENLPAAFQLAQNYPNPFNPSTKIRYLIPAETEHTMSLQFVSLKVYDLLGREIATLVNEEKLPGNYEIIFDGRNLTSGVYFYQLRSGSFVSTKKLALVK